MFSTKLYNFNSALIKTSLKSSSTKSIINYIPKQKTITPVKKSEITKKMISFFKQNPIESDKDLSFFVNNETLIDITVQKNFKKNIYEHCIYFQVTDQGISSYKNIVKNIPPTQKTLKYEFKPAHGIIRIFYEVQLNEINGKKYLPINTPPLLFLK